MAVAHTCRFRRTSNACIPLCVLDVIQVEGDNSVLGCPLVLRRPLGFSRDKHRQRQFASGFVQYELALALILLIFCPFLSFVIRLCKANL